MKTSWSDYYDSAEIWEIKNLSSLDVIKLFNDNDISVCVTTIVQNNNLVILTIDSMDHELMILNHFTQIGGSLRMKEPKIVALNGFDAVGSVARFKSDDENFGCIVSRDVPNAEGLENFNSEYDFVALSSYDDTKKNFRNVVLLLPYAVAAFLSISSRDHSGLACIVKAAYENFKINYSGNKEFN